MPSMIKVSNLGKKYVIRHTQPRRRDYRRFSEDLAAAVTWPARAMRAHCNGHANRRRTREDFWALRDVDFEVQEGEVVGIIGRNGAGKSTLLKLLSRITEPTTGRIELRGRVASLLEVGTGFHPELTGRENVFLNGAILGMTRVEIKRKFDEIVDFAEVEQFIDTPVKRYSSGMHVRLAFAVAAHLEPEILVVDEVLAVGDAEFQKKCLGKMRDVAKVGRTVLFVSHNMAAVRLLCGRGLVLDQGLVACDGVTSKALEYYQGRAIKACEVEFPAQPNRPTITAVRVDPQRVHRGDIHIEISFASPFPLNPPVPGFVLYSLSGTPVFGSNPRIHEDGFVATSKSTGVISFASRELPICSGCYRLSVWLGDWYRDYDHVADALSFEFTNPAQSPHRTDSEVIGHIHHSGTWQIRDGSSTSDIRNGRQSHDFKETAHVSTAKAR